ncbi:MAG: hypothetical protein AAF709_02135, partial [Pseudomonadota bacterium]
MRPINDIERRWYWVWLALLAHATLLVATAGQFDHELYLHEVPAISLALGLVTAGAIALFLPGCIAASHNVDKQTQLR